MSFFDEGGETRVRAPRPRQAATGPAPPRVDPQALLVRRAVAVGVALVVIILLVIGIRGCLNSQHTSALKSYNNDVSSIVQESQSQVSKPFFTLLQGAASSGKSPLDIEVQINQYRVIAEGEAQRAASLSVPGEMAGAQNDLLLMLDMRAEGVKKIADEIRSALGGQPSAATNAIQLIAGQMQVFLASDVIYVDRVMPLIQQVLRDQHVSGQVTASAASAQFLPDLGWLSPTTVAQRLGGRSGTTSGTVAPGTHGHALTAVAVNGTDLTPGTTNHIKVTPNLAFTVKVSNQGSNDEFNVGVSIKLTGSGTPITVTQTIARTTAGQQASVAVPLGTTPPIGVPLTLTANVAPVPGEKTLTNNSQTYTVVFSR